MLLGFQPKSKDVKLSMPKFKFSIFPTLFQGSKLMIARDGRVHLMAYVFKAFQYIIYYFIYIHIYNVSIFAM